MLSGSIYFTHSPPLALKLDKKSLSPVELLPVAALTAFVTKSKAAIFNYPNIESNAPKAPDTLLSPPGVVMHSTHLNDTEKVDTEFYAYPYDSPLTF